MEGKGWVDAEDLQLANDSGAVTYSKAFDPFGAVTQTSGSTQTAYGYTGEYTSNDLVYLRARHYMPSTGRFFTRDPFSGYADRPGSQNPYAYGLNNPVLYTDPSGEAAQAAVTAAIGALFGGGGNLVYQLSRNNGNWECVDWGQVALWAGAGAVAGLMVGIALPVILSSPDTAFDLASLAYSAYTGDAAGFTMDLFSLIIPGVTGLSAISRADDALRTLNRLDNVYDTVHYANRADNYYDITHVAYRSSDEAFSGFNRAFPKQSEQAAKIMEDAAKASNIELNRFVDRVIFDPAENAPYFRVRNGKRIIGIDVKSLKETQEMQLLIGSHELAHAEQFNHILLRQFDNDFSSAEKFWNSSYYDRFNFPNGYANYYKREAVAERLALSRLKINLENLPAEVIERANVYIESSRFRYQNILPK